MSKIKTDATVRIPTPEQWGAMGAILIECDMCDKAASVLTGGAKVTLVHGSKNEHALLYDGVLMVLIRR